MTDIMVSITKRRVLEEMLEFYSTLKRTLSEGMRNMVPEKGCREIFYVLEAKQAVVREMMRDLEKEEKRVAESVKPEKFEKLSVLRRNAESGTYKEISMVEGSNHETGGLLDGVLRQS